MAPPGRTRPFPAGLHDLEGPIRARPRVAVPPLVPAASHSPRPPCALLLLLLLLLLPGLLVRQLHHRLLGGTASALGLRLRVRAPAQLCAAGMASRGARTPSATRHCWCCSARSWNTSATLKFSRTLVRKNLSPSDRACGQQACRAGRPCLAQAGAGCGRRLGARGAALGAPSPPPQLVGPRRAP